MKAHDLPSLDILEDYFDYIPETGVILWKKDRYSQKVKGKEASNSVGRYSQIKLFGRHYLAHRIAYALYYQEQLSPEVIIDHIDRNGLNNKICNLRKTDYSGNGLNRGAGLNNTSGIVGVHYAKRINKWQARIQVKGKRVNLGYFDCKEDAINARHKAEADLQCAT